MASRVVSFLLGDQLFARRHLSQFRDTPIFMAEDRELCSRYSFHKHKLVYFLSAMRRHAETLADSGYTIEYTQLSSSSEESSYIEKLEKFIRAHDAAVLQCFEIEDTFFADRIKRLVQTLGIELREHSSPMFLFSRAYFKNYLAENNGKPFLHSFYKGARREKGILVESDGSPAGGKWSFDAQNRKKLPSTCEPPPPPDTRPPSVVKDVSDLIEEMFPEHPGECSNFWLPIDEGGAKRWLTSFLDERFRHFGDYQDAISSRSPFVYHSVLSPFLNSGLLTPDDVLDGALRVAEDNEVPLHTLEGFVRQVLGWREFLRGVYHSCGEKLEQANFFSHEARLGRQWYSGTTGIEVLDYSIQKSIRYGYAHHIERLMVLGNWMLLCRTHPRDVYKWFMEMFIDSGDWVMSPNVYGMSQYSEGGLFATKPYICGSNYFRKMGDFKGGDWEDIADGLYWSFIEDHKEFFTSQPRLALMTKMLDKMDPELKKRRFHAAREFRERVMVS